MTFDLYFVQLWISHERALPKLQTFQYQPVHGDNLSILNGYTSKCTQPRKLKFGVGYHIVGNFRMVLIFVYFVCSLRIRKIKRVVCACVHAADRTKFILRGFWSTIRKFAPTKIFCYTVVSKCSDLLATKKKCRFKLPDN